MLWHGTETTWHWLCEGSEINLGSERQAYSCWRDDRRCCSEHSTAEWNERETAGQTSMAVLGVVLYSQVGLACKNALSSPIFKDIEEMLLRLYHLYRSHQGNAESSRLLQMSWKLWLISQMEVTYQCNLKDHDGSHRRKLYSVLLITMVCTLLTWQPWQKIQPSEQMIGQRYKAIQTSGLKASISLEVPCIMTS